MSVERPFLQAPYESLHLNFRHARQKVDHELREIRAELASAPGALSDAQTAHLRRRLSELQQQLAECRRNHLRHARTLKLRAQTAAAIDAALARGDTAQATQACLQTLVASYLADAGRFPRTLQALVQREPQLRELVDWDVIAEENEFVEAVARRSDYGRGLKWCRQHRALLARHGIDLEFRLQMLQYKHMLVDDGDVLGAIAYARKAFAKAGPTKSAVLLRAAGALYGPVKVRAREPAVMSSPLEDDSGDGTGDAALERALRAAFRRVHGRGPAYMLLSRVGIGLAALKTRQCGKTPLPPGHEHCPACAPALRAIADQVPYAMHTTSILDEDVAVLPNDNIIGLKQLKAYTQRAWPDSAANGLVVDPETGEVFGEHELTFVYPL